MKKIEEKINFEKKIISQMIGIYCKKKHKQIQICDECREVLDYANKKIENCKFIEVKSFCSNCKSPCYSPVMREKIREIMKFSGKRIILYHPILTIKHIFYKLNKK